MGGSFYTSWYASGLFLITSWSLTHIYIYLDILDCARQKIGHLLLRRWCGTIRVILKKQAKKLLTKFCPFFIWIFNYFGVIEDFPLFENGSSNNLKVSFPIFPFLLTIFQSLLLPLSGMPFL